jgi:hypothetical protein
MNLKEIGTLLISIFVLSTLLIGYKYYVARGKVFLISRMIIFKYSVRFLLLLSLMWLCFYSLETKNSINRSSEKVETILFAISANASSLTWNKLQDEFKELPQNSYYTLVLYNPKLDNFEQIIPSTNFDSFLNLVEQTHTSITHHQKHLFLDRLRFKPADDQYISYRLIGDEWNFMTKDQQANSLFSSKSTLYTWIGSSYVKVYLVIGLLLLLFIDIVFTTKAIKI